MMKESFNEEDDQLIKLRKWANNIFNTTYAIRGFYFGLEPPLYEDKLYLSYGEPFTIGLSLNYKF